MTVADVLIIVFGLPTVGLLGSIFRTLGRIEVSTENNITSIKELWSAINHLKGLIR